MNDISTYIPIIGIVVVIIVFLLFKTYQLKKEQKKPKKRTIKEPKGEPSIPREEITQAVHTVTRKQPSEHVIKVESAIEHPEKIKYTETIATPETLRIKTYHPKKKKKALLVRNDSESITLLDYIIVVAFAAGGLAGAYISYKSDSLLAIMLAPLILGIICGILFTDNLRIKRIRKEENVEWEKKNSTSELLTKENLLSCLQDEFTTETKNQKESQLKPSKESSTITHKEDSLISESQDQLLSLKQFVKEKSKKSEK